MGVAFPLTKIYTHEIMDLVHQYEKTYLLVGVSRAQQPQGTFCCEVSSANDVCLLPGRLTSPKKLFLVDTMHEGNLVNTALEFADLLRRVSAANQSMPGISNEPIDLSSQCNLNVS